MTRFEFHTANGAERHDPCTSMQADISALLDRELDDSHVRRVLVHLEVCPRCNRFLRSLRTQVDLHRALWAQVQDDAQSVVEEPDVAPEEFADCDDPFAGDLFADVELSESEDDGAFLEQLMTESRERLGEVFYQLGRAYVLLSVSPQFFTVTAREIVPIPEYRQRAQALLAGVSGSEVAPPEGRDGWTPAHRLLDGQLDSAERNLDKGQNLLNESLRIRPDSCSARVMLGQCFLHQNELSRARVQFQWVLRRTRRDGGPKDRTTGVPLRTYALESLGNINLVEGKHEEALVCFRRVVASGAVEIHSTFSTSLLNVAYSALLAGCDAEAQEAFETYYDRFPEKRSETAQMFELRPKVRELVAASVTLSERLAVTCPEWFGSESTRLGDRANITFSKVDPGRPRDSSPHDGTPTVGGSK